MANIEKSNLRFEKRVMKKRELKMRRYDFEVQSIHPPEYRGSFYGIFDKERARGNLSYRKVIKEIAPPPELLRDFVFVSAATLTIIKHLYDFYKEIKSKKGKVYITIKGKSYDLEAYSIDELKVKMSTEDE